MSDTLRVGSTCTGYGGFVLALQEVLDVELEWYSEIEKHPSTLLAERFPGVPNLGDLKEIDWASTPSIDIFTGGYPCQPFSAAGQRKGADDPRHLWPHLREAIRFLRPRFALFENVAGHRSLGFDAVLRDCAEDGLSVRWVSVRASDVGAPHRRERLFFVVAQPGEDFADLPWRTGLVADADGERLEEPRLTEPGGPQEPWAVVHQNSAATTDGLRLLPTPAAHMSGNTPQEHLRKKPGRSYVTDLKIIVENDLLKTGGQLPSELLPTPTATDAKGARNSTAIRANADTYVGHEGNTLTDVMRLLPTPRTTDCRGSGDHGDGGRDLRTTISLLPTPNASDATGGGQHPSKRTGHSRQIIDTAVTFDLEPSGDVDWGPYEAAIHRWAYVLGRPAPHPHEPNRNGNPRLTVAFDEWMMGLPEGWIGNSSIPYGAKIKLCGNGGVPQAIAYALRILLTPTIQEVAA